MDKQTESREQFEAWLKSRDCKPVAWLKDAYWEVWQACCANSPALPDGWKLVPIEPTESMVIDGFESEAWDALGDAALDKKGWPYSCRESAECVTDIFKAMLAAAPMPPTTEK